MKVYFSEPTRDVRRSTYALERLTDLYDIGFINDDSQVWIDISNFDPSIWVLNNRSSLVWMHISSDPGCVRLTEDRIRWGTTYASTLDSPDEVLNLADFPADAINNFTYVVKHYSPDKTVSIIDKSQTQQIINGMYLSDSGVAVIDANAYVPSKDTAEPGEFEHAHAVINGASYLTAGMTKKRRLDFRRNMANYSVDLPEEYMQGLVDVRKGFYTQISDQIAEALEDRIKPINESESDSESEEI